MFATFEHGRILSKIIIAWILCSRGNACTTKPTPPPALEVPTTTLSPGPDVQQEDIKTIQVGGEWFYWIGGRRRDKKSWPKARDWCKRKGKRGDLATHLTEHQMEKIFTHLPSWASHVWVGARMHKSVPQQDFKDSYKWVEPSYSHPWPYSISGTDGLWRYTSPEGYQCMAMERVSLRKDGERGPAYRDFKCNYVFSFICEGICTWCRRRGGNITDASSTETSLLH